MKWNEARGIKGGICRILNDIAMIYLAQEEVAEAQNYFDQALEIAEEIEDKFVMAAAIGNIGNIYVNSGEYALAEEYIARALQLNKEMGDQQRIGQGMLQSAKVSILKRDNTQATLFVDQAADIFVSIGVKNTTAYIMLYRGSIDLDQGNFNKAIQWCNKGLIISQEIASIELQRDACDCP